MLSSKLDIIILFIPLSSEVMQQKQEMVTVVLTIFQGLRTSNAEARPTDLEDSSLDSLYNWTEPILIRGVGVSESLQSVFGRGFGVEGIDVSKRQENLLNLWVFSLFLYRFARERRVVSRGS